MADDILFHQNLFFLVFLLAWPHGVLLYGAQWDELLIDMWICLYRVVFILLLFDN